MIAYYDLLVQQDLNLGTGATTKRNPAGGTLVGTQVGIHSFAIDNQKTSSTWDASTIANGGSASTTITVTGASLGDFVLASFNLSLQGLTLSSYVSAANTVTVVLSNLTGGSVDLASGTVSVLVLKSR